jgi:glycerol kinase
VYDVFEAMQAYAGRPILSMKVDGGGSENRLLMQLQSDILQIELVKSVAGESTSLGAESLAGLTLGIWQDRADLSSLWQEAERFIPLADEAALHQSHSLWHKAIERAQHWEIPNTVE